MVESNKTHCSVGVFFFFLINFFSFFLSWFQSKNHNCLQQLKKNGDKGISLYRPFLLAEQLNLLLNVIWIVWVQAQPQKPSNCL
jgi:hypothetical protein